MQKLEPKSLQLRSFLPRPGEVDVHSEHKERRSSQFSFHSMLEDVQPAESGQCTSSSVGVEVNHQDESLWMSACREVVRRNSGDREVDGGKLYQAKRIRTER